MAKTQVQRRNVLAGVAAALIAPPLAALAGGSALTVTPGQTEGPFYPLSLPADMDADLVRVHHGAVTVSAATGDGVEPLLDTIAARLRSMKPIVELEVPYERGDVVAALHRDGEVLVEVHGEGGTRVRARLPQLDVAKFQEFVVKNGAKQS